jgi:hypothetical protein
LLWIPSYATLQSASSLERLIEVGTRRVNSIASKSHRCPVASVRRNGLKMKPRRKKTGSKVCARSRKSECQLTCKRAARIRRPRPAAAAGERRQPEERRQRDGGAEQQRGHALRPHGPAPPATPRSSASASSASSSLRRGRRRLLPPAVLLPHPARPHASSRTPIATDEAEQARAWRGQAKVASAAAHGWCGGEDGRMLAAEHEQCVSAQCK